MPRSFKVVVHCGTGSLKGGNTGLSSPHRRTTFGLGNIGADWFDALQPLYARNDVSLSCCLRRQCFYNMSYAGGIL